MWSKNLNCACSAPPAEVFIQSPTGRKFSISGRERETIESSWMKIVDKDTLGEDIFQHIFAKKPSLKRLWGLDQESIGMETLRDSAKFKQHAKNFVMFLDVAVRSLALDGLYVISLAKTVGRRHVLFKEVSFDAENWLLFKTAVMEALEPHVSSAEVKQRWHHFIMFLVTEVKDAFNKEIQAVHTSSSFMSSDQTQTHIARDRWTIPSMAQFCQHLEEGENKRKSIGGDSIISRKRKSALALREDLSHIQNCVAEEEKEYFLMKY